MHGHHSLLNVDLALMSHEERIAAVDRNHAMVLASMRRSRPWFHRIRLVAGSFLIVIGERLRPECRERKREEIGPDLISLKLAR